MATQWAKESRDEGWRLEAREHQVEVWHNNQLFTAYKFYPDQFRPWFYPVNSPLGRTVTEELNDYPVMVSNYPLDGPELSAGVLPHLRSLSIAHGDVNGHDVWHEWPDTERQGRIVHLGVTTGRTPAPSVDPAQWPVPVLPAWEWTARGARERGMS